MTLYERFWSKVSLPRGGTDGCWLWTGALNKGGYGRIGLGGRGAGGSMAHRVSYAFYRGEFPVDMELDHLCRNRACVNPAHLEPVSRRDNLRRGAVPLRARKSICDAGHSMVGENVIIFTKRGYTIRACRACKREYANRYARRVRAAAA